LLSLILFPQSFLVYVSVVLVLCAVLVLYFSPRFGRSNILVYIGICSLLGAFTVSSVKGLAIAINTDFSRCRKREVSLTCACVFLQVNYLNKSLDTFNTLLVYPIYYVLFTSVVLSTSIILFQEWRGMSAVDVVTTLGAFVVIVVGVAMLHLFKELNYLHEINKKRLVASTKFKILASCFPFREFTLSDQY
uniref:NIPA like domain containing 4 n=1 Tax=Seriola lalandi dorsalis TaxID=1841481 RepID=A0A3B4X7K9_SERLL